MRGKESSYKKLTVNQTILSASQLISGHREFLFSDLKSNLLSVLKINEGKKRFLLICKLGAKLPLAFTTIKPQAKEVPIYFLYWKITSRLERTRTWKQF